MRFITYIAAFSLILLLMAGTGVRTLITVRFYVNQTEIAATKCENKAKPELKCNGKCYLAKQLKESENSSERSVPVSPERFHFPEISFTQPAHLFEFLTYEKEQQLATFFLFQDNSFQFSTILKPPPEFC